MANKRKSEYIRPIDVRPGDLIATKLHPHGVVVVSSDLVEPGSPITKGQRIHKHQWWVRTVWADLEGRVNTQTERFPCRRFDEKCITRLTPSD